MESQPRELRDYRMADGTAPFKEWLLDLDDARSRAKIIVRLKRVALGNFGDCRSVGEGVLELRIHWGPGYRVYFGLDGMALIILLCGGDKSGQSNDIEQAHFYWNDYRRRQ